MVLVPGRLVLWSGTWMRPVGKVLLIPAAGELGVMLALIVWSPNSAKHGTRISTNNTFCLVKSGQFGAFM